MTTARIDDWRERYDQIWREPNEDTEMLVPGTLAAAALIAMGGFVLATLTQLLPPLLICG